MFFYLLVPNFSSAVWQIFYFRWLRIPQLNNLQMCQKILVQCKFFKPIVSRRNTFKKNNKFDECFKKYLLVKKINTHLYRWWQKVKLIFTYIMPALVTSSHVLQSIFREFPQILVNKAQMLMFRMHKNLVIDLLFLSWKDWIYFYQLQVFPLRV